MNDPGEEKGGIKYTYMYIGSASCLIKAAKDYIINHRYIKPKRKPSRCFVHSQVLLLRQLLVFLPSHPTPIAFNKPFLRQSFES